MEKDDLFGEAIYVYTDGQAVADGVLVDISNCGLMHNEVLIDRTTNSVWADFMEPFKEDDRVEGFRMVMRFLLPTAVDNDGDGYLLVVNGDGAKKMWLVRNERNHYTLMYPEDY